MSLIPLAAEFSYRTGTPRESCTNYYAEPTPQGPRPYSLRPRNGIVEQYRVGIGPAWLTIQIGALTYVLSGNGVYYNGSLIGTVATGGQKQAAFSDEQLVIVSGGNAYLIEYIATPASITVISDPDLPSVSGVVFAGGRFLYPATDFAGRYYFSEIGDAANIDGLSFENAESNPDPIVRMETIGDQVAIFGTDSLEFQSPTNDPAAPFQRAPGQTQDKGCVAAYSVIKCDNSLFWIGRDEGSGRTAYRTSGGVPIRVSTHSIEAALQEADDADITAATAFCYVGEGHTFYTINVPDTGSYSLDISTNKWAEWESYGLDTFRLRSGSGPLYGDHEGRIFRFDAEAVDDDGNPITRVCSCFIPVESRGKCNVLVLEIATGTSPLAGPEAMVEMRYTDELTGDWTDWDASSLGLHGERTVRVAWWQLGRLTSPGRLFEFRITDPALSVAYGVMINVRP